MRIFTFFAAFAALFLSFSSYAHADDITVAANRTTHIGQMSIYYQEDCGNPAKPTVTYSPKPAHGTIRVEWKAAALGKKAKSGCAGKNAYGLSVWYTPNAGYRGKDYVKIGMRSVTYGTNSHYMAWKLNITVK